jgi:hypothetical protein
MGAKCSRHMVEKLHAAACVFQDAPGSDIWIVQSLEGDASARPRILVAFAGEDARALAIEYATSKFFRVEVQALPRAFDTTPAG